jgi:indole-3-glycerol phosphate synthase
MLVVDSARLADLSGLLPAGCVPVAESGISGPDDAAAAAALGYRAALVGSALMRAADPAALVAALLEAGRCS